MQTASPCYKFARVDGFADAGPVASASTDALSAISVWRALDADRSFTLLADVEHAALVAQVSFPAEHLPHAMRDLRELCQEHHIKFELMA